MTPRDCDRLPLIELGSVSAELVELFGGDVVGHRVGVDADDPLRRARSYLRAHGNCYDDLGEMLAEQHRYRESEAAYRAVIRITPEAPSPHTALAGALLAQRRYADAAAECREAIRLNFDEPRAHINLWDSLEYLASYDELEAAARAVIERRPDHADAHARLGRALFARGRYAEATDAYRTAVALHPEVARFRDWLALALAKAQ